jgi:hypothetical protein
LEEEEEGEDEDEGAICPVTVIAFSLCFFLRLMTLLKHVGFQILSSALGVPLCISVFFVFFFIFFFIFLGCVFRRLLSSLRITYIEVNVCTDSGTDNTHSLGLLSVMICSNLEID